MIYLVSYATKKYYRSQDLMRVSALKHGVDRVFAFREKDLQASRFYERNEPILKQRRGGGYWIWKPYFLLRVMERAEPDDIVIYCDSGIEIIRPLAPLIELCRRRKHAVLFQTHGQRNSMWTKRDCFVYMGCDEKKYWNAQQLMGSFHVHINNERNRKLIQTWKSYCEDARVVTDMPNQCGLSNLPDFKDHRHDQSILSLLAVKQGMEIFRAPSSMGNRFKMIPAYDNAELEKQLDNPYRNSKYDTLLNHHRNRL
ncbi:hypothetical protein [Paenibacillus koleovorans]|uniref:hypothetical protein n=1 Tax=Paenibacillus koleovorans TaxID=121608 RepID=UPI000FD95707|nr:hypothetical protein [Paenibacillus koleovorans]